jgi:hypothetical protein
MTVEFFSRKGAPWDPMHRRLCGLQHRSERFGVEIGSLSLPGIVPCIRGYSSLSLVTVC